MLCDTEREKEMYEGDRSLSRYGFTLCALECACSKAEWFCQRAVLCESEFGDLNLWKAEFNLNHPS